MGDRGCQPPSPIHAAYWLNSVLQSCKKPMIARTASSGLLPCVPLLLRIGTAQPYDPNISEGNQHPANGNACSHGGSYHRISIDICQMAR